jgi:hypothetical protein
MLCKAAERTVSGLGDLIGKLVDIFQPEWLKSALYRLLAPVFATRPTFALSAQDG